MHRLPDRTKESPWRLKTPPATSEFTMHTDDQDGRRILVCTVGSTILHYDARDLPPHQPCQSKFREFRHHAE